MEKECKDHLGNTYNYITDMCAFYQIKSSIYRDRIRNGWSVKEALTVPVDVLKQQQQIHFHTEGIKDHLGNTYTNRAEMCSFYHITVKAYERRLERGWSLEDALTKPYQPVSAIYTDHLGNTYSSTKEMCDTYNIRPKTYRKRIRLGWSTERALTEPLQFAQQIKREQIKRELKSAQTSQSSKKVQKIHKKVQKIHKIKKTTILDHLGIEYPTLTKMCEKYNIPRQTFKNRTEKWGWDVERALTTPPKHYNEKSFVKKIFYDHLGNSYNTVGEMCNHYNITIKAYYNRIARGHSLEDALLTPMNDKNSECQDPFGNVFSCHREMCEYYGISLELFEQRLYFRKWTLEEALLIPKCMYIGEYRVAECLKRLNVKFYHDCTIKTIFTDLGISVDWNDFLSELQSKLGLTGCNWSKLKIQKLRPDFVIYTDEENKIRGIIEFDGEQHQNFVEFFFKTIEEFYRRSNTDFVKQSFWEYMNIPMLRIRHDQIDKIDDMVKDFIDNPQNYIHNHNTYLSEEEYWSILTKQKQQIELAFDSAYTCDNQIESEDEEYEIEC